MTTGTNRVLVCRLYQRTSVRGHRYLAGRLGEAKVVTFLHPAADPKFGATAVFNVYLQALEQQEERHCGLVQRRPSSAAPGGASRTTRVQRWERPAENKSAADRLFQDGPIDDVGDN
jgi:hypothetical protein